jgi:hypothetical protein
MLARDQGNYGLMIAIVVVLDRIHHDEEEARDR